MSAPLKDIALAEFNALRAEIASRASAQHMLLNFDITVIGAVGAFVLSYKADPIVTLLLPLLCPALGMLWIDHAINISNIGEYIAGQLTKTLLESVGAQPCAAMQYEQWASRHERRWFLRVVLFALPIVVMFGAFPAASLVLTYSLLQHKWHWFLWSSGLFLTLMYLCFWSYLMLMPYTSSAGGGRSAR